MSVKIMVGDVREQLRLLPDESVNCVVTSPPYWALRDYGTAKWEGGDPDCQHRSPTMKEDRDESRAMLSGSAATNNMQLLNAVSAGKCGKCGKCGAVRTDSQLGLEPTPQLHVTAMVDVFREVKRVLRKDGVCWVNYGDSYAGSINGRSAEDTKALGNDDRTFRNKPINNAAGGLKPKDLCGVPFRFALAMQDDGWWWRSCLPWVKRNGMPESITDRPASSVEYVFMFTKGEWKSRVVKFADLSGERVHFGKYVGTERPDAGTNEVCISLATALFDRAQREHDFGLPAFYAQEWKQHDDNGDSPFIIGLPAEHRPAIFAARFLCGDVSAEHFLEQLHSLRIALGDSNAFLMSGVPSEVLRAPNVLCDGDGTIAVHHAGKVSKIDFVHRQIVVSRPVACKYWYDHAAVRRELADSSVDRLAQDVEGQSGSGRANGGRKSNGPMKAVATKQAGHGRRHAGFNARWDEKEARQRGTPPRHAQYESSDQSGLDDVERGSRNFRNSDLFFESLEGPHGLLTDAEGNPLALDVPPQPFREAHFATFPPKLIEPLIKAGCPPLVCGACGKPHERQTEQRLVPTPAVSFGSVPDARDGQEKGHGDQGSNRSRDGHIPGMATEVRTLGWQPGCACKDAAAVPGTVLDCFGGAATTGLVGDRLGRDAILIELNEAYAEIGRKRIKADAGMFADVA